MSKSKTPITPEGAAELIVSNYQLSEAESAHSSPEASKNEIKTAIRNEVKGEFETLFDIAGELDYTNARISGVLEQFSHENQKGTDIDDKYGVGMSELFERFKNDIPAPKGIDQGVWESFKKLTLTSDFGSLDSKQKLFLLIDFTRAIRAYSLTIEEQKSILDEKLEKLISAIKDEKYEKPIDGQTFYDHLFNTIKKEGKALRNKPNSKA